MTRPQPFRHDDDRRAFLVERYLSPAAADDLATSTDRLARLCARLNDPGPGNHGVQVEYLYSAYLPTEDTCFCLFRAPSADAVRAVNDDADFAFDRIIDAVLLPGTRR